MGTQCSCSKIQVSKQDEISQDCVSEERTSVKSVNNDGMAISEICQHEIQEARTTLNEENVKDDHDCISRLSSLKQKSERKKMKKVVQVVLPGNEKENHDDVKFVEKQSSDKSEVQLIAKTLKSHFILSQLSLEEIQYVVQKMKYCEAKKGAYIFKQGDPSFSYYIILSGKCSVHIDNELKKYLEPGNSFGDLGIIYSAPRSATIFAETDCTLAELNSKTFRKIINDLNSMYQKQNKQVLEQIEFYKNLTENQKNALASNCIMETYQPGQIIFNKGDAANAFYIVQEGIVTVLQKNLDLKTGENVGVNAIIGNTNATRSSSLIAKTRCKLISLTREIIAKNLGDNINNVLRKNLVLKILKQSDIWDMYTERQWLETLQNLEVTFFKKGDVILPKNSIIPPLNLCVVLKADARSVLNPRASFYIANSIIQPNKVYKKQEYALEDSFVVDNEAELIRLHLPLKIEEDKKETKIDRLCSSDSTSSSCKGKIKLKDFIILRSLRAGNFGRVYACFNKSTKSKYAIKVMNKQTLIAANALSYIQNETQLLTNLPEHPFVVKYYDTFNYQNLIMIVLELVEGEDLFDGINHKLPLRFQELKFLVAQLVLIVEFLHENKVVYRDLKPENVMLGSNGYLTLVDFGTAKKLTIQKRYRTTTIIGTPHYMAPEILLGKGYSFTADWWSLGVMIYEMACGKLPYGESLQDPFAVYQEIIKNQLIFSREIETEIRLVLEKLLTKNMYKRMKNGPVELKNMEFFNGINWQKLLSRQYEGKMFPSKSSSISMEQIQRMLAKKKLPLALQVFLKLGQDKVNG